MSLVYETLLGLSSGTFDTINVSQLNVTNENVITSTITNLAVQNITGAFIYGATGVFSNIYDSGILEVVGTGTFNSNLNIADYLTVGLDTTIAGNLIVDTNTTLFGTANIYGDLNLFGAGTSLYVNNNSTFNGTGTFNKNLNVLGNEVLTGNLHVGMLATLQASATVASNLTVGGVTTLNAPVIINSNLQVNGTGTFSNDVNVGGNSLISGNQVVSGNLTVQGYELVDGIIDIAGAATIGSTLTVGATGTFNSNLNIAGTGSFGGSVVVGDILIVENVATIGGVLVASSNLLVDGETYLYGPGQSLYVDQNSLFNGTGTFNKGIALPQTSGFITSLSQQNSTGAVSFALPTNNGMTGYYLESDSKGNTSWVKPACINIVDHGAIGNFSFDNTAIIQSCINLAQLTGDCVFIPQGDFVISGRLDIFASCSIKGVGYFQGSVNYKGSALYQTGTTPTISIQTTEPVYLESFGLIGGGTATEGIQVSSNFPVGSPTSNNNFSHFYDLFLEDFVTGIHIYASESLSIKNCVFESAFTTPIHIENLFGDDSGDTLIDGCTFSCGGIPNHISMTSGGGLRITNCKGLTPNAVSFFSSTVNDVDYFINNNSLEGFSGQILLLNNNNAGSITITGNELAGTASITTPVIQFGSTGSTGTTNYNMVCSDNVIYLNGAFAGNAVISCYHCDSFNISNNTFYAPGGGTIVPVFVDAHSTNGYLGRVVAALTSFTNITNGSQGGNVIAQGMNLFFTASNTTNYNVVDDDISAAAFPTIVTSVNSGGFTITEEEVYYNTSGQTQVWQVSIQNIGINASAITATFGVGLYYLGNPYSATYYSVPAGATYTVTNSATILVANNAYIVGFNYQKSGMSEQFGNGGNFITIAQIA